MGNSDAIRDISKACRITDNIFRMLEKELRKERFSTELDVYRFLKKEAYARKCRLAYKPIVAMQENGAEIHHKADDSKLKKGFLVVDFRVRHRGYCSDCTRTFYLGKPSKKEESLYNLVLEAELTSLNHSRPGVYAADIDAIGRAVLWGYFKNFVHAIGHGVGKKIHQSPKVSPRSKSILKKGQIITIEPGLYFKKWFGIRIEDTIIVEDNPVILTKTRKKLIKI